MESENETKTWLGSSVADICRGKGPWAFHVTPVSPSKFHTVIYEFPVTINEAPRPYHNGHANQWDDDHVRMPHSKNNLFPVKENGADVIKIRWEIIKDSLQKPIRNSRELEAAIHSYNNNAPTFTALHSFFEDGMEEEESLVFFETLLPKIIHLALQLPQIVQSRIPLLKKNHNRSLSMSQLQISCLLANAFLCTFPWKKDMAGLYPGVNFCKLFAASSRPDRLNSIWEKLKCIFHYFRRVTSTTPLGAVTFERKYVHRSNLPRWDDLDNKLGNTKVHIDSKGTIEDDGNGFLQVDFANKNVGGGVLGYGCVQEEIRFIICPELIISRLFVEQLGDHEAVIVTGCERYSKYTGYANTFVWGGNFIDQTPHDDYGRKKTSVCIIDATKFQKTRSQFYPSAMLRELNKAYVGFWSREKGRLAPIATGNWGCGAFNGQSTLKALLQLMACCVTSRDLVYYTFGEEDLKKEFHEMYTFLATQNVTITQLWRYLCRFCTASLAETHLYSYIQQAYFDNKNQTSIKNFFGGTNVKKKENIPSTSSTTEPTNCKSNELPKSPEKLLNGEEKNEEIKMEGIQSYEDVIQSSPPLVVFRKKSPKNKNKLTREEVTQKLPRTDIAELIDIIEGDAKKGKKNNNEDTLLSHIDKFPKKSRKDDEPQCSHTNGDTLEQMDTDPLNEKTKINLCEDSKGAKRKISDYFQIKNKSN